MRGDGIGQDFPPGWRDDALWRQSQVVEVPENESERFLDLAGFADGRLDPDDLDRVAEWLHGDPVAAGDIAAARALAAAEPAAAAAQSVVARACALVDRSSARVADIITFPLLVRPAPRLRDMARWGSLAAAMAVAGWLGFALGTDTSRAVAQLRQAGDDGFLQELLDPPVGLMSDLTGSTKT